MIRCSGNVITGVVDQASNGFGATGVENGVLIAEAMICGGDSVVNCIHIVVRDIHRSYHAFSRSGARIVNELQRYRCFQIVRLECEVSIE